MNRLLEFSWDILLLIILLIIFMSIVVVYSGIWDIILIMNQKALQSIETVLDIMHYVIKTILVLPPFLLLIVIFLACVGYIFALPFAIWQFWEISFLLFDPVVMLYQAVWGVFVLLASFLVSSLLLFIKSSFE